MNFKNKLFIAGCLFFGFGIGLVYATDIQLGIGITLVALSNLWFTGYIVSGLTKN